VSLYAVYHRRANLEHWGDGMLENWRVGMTASVSWSWVSSWPNRAALILKEPKRLKNLVGVGATFQWASICCPARSFASQDSTQDDIASRRQRSTILFPSRATYDSTRFASPWARS
jgi:hypothetical protein